MRRRLQFPFNYITNFGRADAYPGDEFQREGLLHQELRLLVGSKGRINSTTGPLRGANSIPIDLAKMPLFGEVLEVAAAGI